MQPFPLISGRACGDCAQCCKLGEIPGFKPYNAWCQFCSTHHGCDAYESRPQPCRDFNCHYLMSDLGEHWRPNACGTVVSVYDKPARLTVSVDPDLPQRWREEPYIAQIQHWAQSGAVTIMVGLTAYAATPERIEALGELTDAHTLVITELETSHGIRYRSQIIAKQG